MPATPDEPLLDQATAAFIQGAVSINVGARDAQNLATVARAYGCRVTADRRDVTVFVRPTHAQRVLANLTDNGAIAVVFSRPSTHQTIQLKGHGTRITALDAADMKIVAAYCDSIVAELRAIGFAETFGRAIVPEPGAELVAVSFTPTAAFNQTPGPKAGQPVGR